MSKFTNDDRCDFGSYTHFKDFTSRIAIEFNEPKKSDAVFECHITEHNLSKNGMLNALVSYINHLIYTRGVPETLVLLCVAKAFDDDAEIHRFSTEDKPDCAESTVDDYQKF